MVRENGIGLVLLARDVGHGPDGGPRRVVGGGLDEEADGLVILGVGVGVPVPVPERDRADAVEELRAADEVADAGGAGEAGAVAGAGADRGRLAGGDQPVVEHVRAVVGIGSPEVEVLVAAGDGPELHVVDLQGALIAVAGGGDNDAAPGGADRGDGRDCLLAPLFVDALELVDRDEELCEAGVIELDLDLHDLRRPHCAQARIGPEPGGANVGLARDGRAFLPPAAEVIASRPVLALDGGLPVAAVGAPTAPAGRPVTALVPIGAMAAGLAPLPVVRFLGIRALRFEARVRNDVHAGRDRVHEVHAVVPGHFVKPEAVQARLGVGDRDVAVQIEELVHPSCDGDAPVDRQVGRFAP